MNTAASRPVVNALTEETSKGLNQEAEMCSEPCGALSEYTLTSAVTENSASMNTSTHSSQRCSAAETSMPT
jgi:hypothetical protein